MWFWIRWYILYHIIPPLIGSIKYVWTKTKSKSQSYICWPGHCSPDIVSPETARGCAHCQSSTFLISFFPVSLAVEYIKYLRRDLGWSCWTDRPEARAQLIRFHRWSGSDTLTVEPLFFFYFCSHNSDTEWDRNLIQNLLGIFTHLGK